jgi:hypothetical protein
MIGLVHGIADLRNGIACDLSETGLKVEENGENQAGLGKIDDVVRLFLNFNARS